MAGTILPILRRLGFGASLKDVYAHREAKAKAKQGAPGSQRRAQYEKLRKRAEKVYAKGFEGHPFKGFGGHRPAEQLLDPKSKHHNPKAYRYKIRKIMSKLDEGFMKESEPKETRKLIRKAAKSRAK